MLSQQKDSALLFAWLSGGSISGGLCASLICARKIRTWVASVGGVGMTLGCTALALLPYGSTGFFTALNDGLTSAIISFLRTLVFQIAAVMLLPLIWDIDGIWWSVVVAEVMAVLVGIIFLLAKRKKYQYM